MSGDVLPTPPVWLRKIHVTVGAAAAEIKATNSGKDLGKSHRKRMEERNSGSGLPLAGRIPAAHLSVPDVGCQHLVFFVLLEIKGKVKLTNSILQLSDY